MTKYKTLKEIVEQIKKCDFECEAGPLINNEAFRRLAELADVKLPKYRNWLNEDFDR